MHVMGHGLVAMGSDTAAHRASGTADASLRQVQEGAQAEQLLLRSLAGQQTADSASLVLCCGCKGQLTQQGAAPQHHSLEIVVTPASERVTHLLV
jgi:hypothetical protein